jgi:hypothetical protein
LKNLGDVAVIVSIVIFKKGFIFAVRPPNIKHKSNGSDLNIPRYFPSALRKKSNDAFMAKRNKLFKHFFTFEITYDNFSLLFDVIECHPHISILKNLALGCENGWQWSLTSEVS